MAQVTELSPVRHASGNLKAEQIRRSGAQVVATSCQNCYQQLNDLNREYKLDIKVKLLVEVMAGALAGVVS